LVLIDDGVQDHHFQQEKRKEEEEKKEKRIVRGREAKKTRERKNGIALYTDLEGMLPRLLNVT
jgi:hypothetical protein